jgi:dodecin
MSDNHTYKKIEIIGSSTHSIDDAIRNAIKQASTTIKNLEWFEVTETRGHIVGGDVGHFQVTLKIGFKILHS